MTLKTRLTDDMKAAMKGGDKASLGVIRLVNAAIKQREVDERVELDDAQVLAVLEKMVKQRKDSVTQYVAADREDLAEIERAEIVVIERYLPAKLGEAEVAAAIDAAIAETRKREFYEKPTQERKRKAAAAVKRHLRRVSRDATKRQRLY